MKEDQNKSSRVRNESAAPILGAHESIEGGIHRAVERAESIGCTALQVFTKNSNQWAAKPLGDPDIASYKTALSKSSISHVMAHDSYLINLCAADGNILRKSREAFTDEIIRCAQLGIRFLVFHPGAHMGAGEGDGLKKIIDALNSSHAESRDSGVITLLETTAGQGTSLGYRFEHLRTIIDGIDKPHRAGVCLDTCHIFAAGYDISTEEGYGAVMREFDDLIGFDFLYAIHVNDSKRELGSRVDRHEHIGKGAIGKIGFRCLMQDDRFRRIPKIIETDKGKDLREDVMNLNLLRRLARITGKPARRKGTR